jgi:hypothetical protein
MSCLVIQLPSSLSHMGLAYTVWQSTTPVINCIIATTNWSYVVIVTVVAKRHFQQYFCNIVTVSFIGRGNRDTRRKPPTCRMSLTNHYLGTVNFKCFNLEYGGTFTKLFMHVSSRNMFPTIRNLQIRVHVYRPCYCCGDWLTLGCFVPMIADVVVSFIGRWNRDTRRKPPTCRMSLTNHYLGTVNFKCQDI